MEKEFEVLLKQGLEELNIEINENQISKFYQYYKLLIEWNKVMNLTAIVELKDVVQKHFIDSLSIIKAVAMSENIKLIDVGTGAGFPGIPLKIMFPDIKVVLLDSLNKKIKFLQEVINKLNLDNIEAIHGRAEDIGRNISHREHYDFCVSRAVANLSILSEYCLPLVKVGGYFIPYKSGKIEEEKQAAKGAIFKLGGELEDCINFQLPNTDMDRSLVIIKKKQPISKKYPRKAGVPGKEPL